MNEVRNDLNERTLTLPSSPFDIGGPSHDPSQQGPLVQALDPAELLAKVASRFEIVSMLGAGGFGIVHLARDLDTASTVALKTIRATHPELKYRLKHEFRALAGLRHRNLVSFYELFAEQDPIFFTMEYVQGTTFLKHVRPGGRLDEARLRRALPQLVEGLSALHEAGKLHRDLKPSNVLVTPDERVVLLDLGLATEVERIGLGTSIELAGTPAYMSPEHFREAPLSFASDWYSVGVMLYEALTARPPIQGTWKEILVALREGRPVPRPEDFVANVPPDLSKLAMSLVARDPLARPGASDIAATLGHPWSPRRTAERSRTATVLVGREPELRQLDDALVQVQSGKPVTVLLDGNSGVGKTSLVANFLERLEGDKETIVLRGRCYERERVPYQGIDSLIDDLCRFLGATEQSTTESMLPRNVTALVRLFPVLERVRAIAGWSDPARLGGMSQQEMRRQAFAALRDLLARVAERRTLVLHIDDLQWGDLDTAALLRDVLRPPDSPVMLLILGFRREDRATSPCVKALVEENLGSTIELHLGPLGDHEAKELVRQLLRVDFLQDEIAKLTRQADGNPLFLQVVARLATDPDAHRNRDGTLDLGGALGARVSGLPASSRALLETLSVAGHPLREPVARRAAGLSGSLWSDWDVLAAQRLVRSSGTQDERTLETFHDRIRQAVLAILPAERARAYHRALAEALEDTTSADPDALAGHYEAAGNIDRALHFTVEAANRADKALAFERAARLFQRAVALASNEDPRRPALIVARAEALANSGRCKEAAATFREAAESPGTKERTVLLRRAAEQLLFGGQIDEARELIRQDLRTAGFPLARNPQTAIASVLLHRIQLLFRDLEATAISKPRASAEELALLEHIYRVCIGLSGVDLFIGGAMAARYILRALDVGDPRSIARGLCLIAGHASIEGPNSRRTRYLVDTMSAHGRHLGDPSVDASVQTVLGLQAYFEGSWRKALTCFDIAEKLVKEECHSLVWELWTGRAVAIWSLFSLGEWKELDRRVLSGLREAWDLGNLYAAQCVSGCFGIVGWLSRGEVDEARRSLEEITERWRVSGFQLQHLYFMIADVFILLFSGKGSEAWSRLNGRWNVVRRSAVTLRLPPFRIHELYVRGICALACAAEDGQTGEARRRLLHEATTTARRLDRIHLPHSHWMGLLLRAGVAAQDGREADALHQLETAVEGLDRREMYAFSAVARRRIAQLRGERPPDFLPGQGVKNPDAIARMLLPGFRDP